jgi:CRP-like cAMP-binding protein
MSRPYGNHFLARLSSEDGSLVSPYLEFVQLSAGRTLCCVREQIEHIYCPRSGILSLTIPFLDGRMGEVALAGWNTVVGGIAALRDPEALCTVTVQIGGSADRIATGDLKSCLEKSHTLRDLLRSHEQALMAQTFQIAACNAVHTLTARLCRWLLQCRDLLGSTRMPLTHAFFASALGVRRPSLTVAAGELQRAGLIKLHRREIELVDVEGLKQASCECYEAMVDQSRRLIQWAPERERQLAR